MDRRFHHGKPHHRDERYRDPHPRHHMMEDRGGKQI